MTPIEVYINLYAQDKIDLADLIEQFSLLPDYNGQRGTLKTVAHFLEQTHPDSLCIELGINDIPLRPSMTPIVLLKVNTLKVALAKILILPDNELLKAFIALATLFRIADTERRNKYCRGACSHEWHNMNREGWDR